MDVVSGEIENERTPPRFSVVGLRLELKLFKLRKKVARRAGFEPARPEANGFQVHPVNHSGTVVTSKRHHFCNYNNSLPSELAGPVTLNIPSRNYISSKVSMQEGLT